MKKHNFWLLNLAALFLFFSSCTKQELSQPDLANSDISASKGANSNLSTDGITGLTLTSATVRGTNMNQVQKNAVLGICWSATNPDPTVEDNVVFTTAVEGAFTVPLNNLEPLSIYYVRVFFASNEVSPGKYANLRYGNVLSFETITNEPVYLTWPSPGRNTVYNNNLGIRWDQTTQGIIETFAQQRIRPGLELVVKVPNPGGDAWTVGVRSQPVVAESFDYFFELNYNYFIGGNLTNNNPVMSDKFASPGEWAKIKYVGTTLSIERSTNAGISWELIASTSNLVTGAPYYIGFWSRGGGPNEIFIRLAQ